jgi:malate dehydrogenase
MELNDCAFPTLNRAVDSTMRKSPFAIAMAMLVGSARAGRWSARDSLLANAQIFRQGRALNEVADRKVRVLVAGNPANTMH